MKIIDIKSRRLDDKEFPKTGGVQFHLGIERIEKNTPTQAPYGLEIGKKELTLKVSVWHPLRSLVSFLKTLRLIRFSYIAHFGLKKYRVKTSFLIGCFLILALVTSLSVAGNILRIKEDLFQKGGIFLQNLSQAKATIGKGEEREFSSHLFDASLTIKEVNKHLASLGEIPKILSKLPIPQNELVKGGLEGVSLGSAWAEFFLRLSGFYEPRYYLVLFQNNAEIRATGGFIGSYALIKVDQGAIEVRKAEGVFNLSGQQSLLLIPPEPIQKISTNWSFHDANWFFDFPTSAKILAWLYEKDGGPTVDGVIAITPQVVEKALSLVGPIQIPQYNLTLTQENFTDTLQYEVETNYKARGQKDPKELITHLTPFLLKRLTTLKDTSALTNLLLESLVQKELLLYLSDEHEEAFILYHNWGGAIVESAKDYLAVVNSNINGYKTDRVIKQQISHHTSFTKEGDIIDTVTIEREHSGGKSPYPWYNKVNADFLRVYVPKGSTLLDVRGQTIEFNDPPLDYLLGGFRELPILKAVREKTYIDTASATRVFEESGKTVFGNWVYASPGEKVKLVYRYLLPFRVHFSHETFPFTLTLQKQPGITSSYWWDIDYPLPWHVKWTSQIPTVLDRDYRLGVLINN